MKKRLHCIVARPILPCSDAASAWFCVSARDSSGLLHCVNIPVENADGSPEELEIQAKELGLLEIEACLEPLPTRLREPWDGHAG